MLELLLKLNEKDAPTLKGKVNDVDKVKPPVLFEVAFELRNDCVIARTSPPSVTENTHQKMQVYPLSQAPWKK